MGVGMIEEWQKLDSEKVAKILAEINPHIEPVPFQLNATAVRAQRLSFYKGYEFFELTDLSTVPGVRKYALYKPGDVNVMNWTNQVIYEANEKAPIVLNERTVTDYVRFFFSYVRGRHGRFVIIEDVDDIRWQADPPLQARKVMQDLLTPVTLVSQDEEGNFNLEAFMLFKDSLFKTKIHVRSDGLISLSDEELKVEGMPVLQDGMVTS